MTMHHDFDDQVRTALRDAANTPTPVGLADRLVANAREGRTAVVPITSSRRWLLPLISAAAVAAVATGVVVGAKLTTDGHGTPPGKSGSPVQTVTPPPPTTPVPAGFRAAQIELRTPRDGYALGNAACTTSTAGCASLIRTSDGGRTWSAVHVPAGVTAAASCVEVPSKIRRCVDKVLFADTGHGYLWSAKAFYRTDDGGQTWRDATSAANLGVGQIVVVGSSVVRLRAAAGCTKNCADRIETSTVGGTAWADHTPNLVTPNRDDAQFAVRGTSVYLAYDAVANRDDSALLRSNDGGRTWRLAASTPCGTRGSTFGLVTGPDSSLALACLNIDTVQVRVAAPGSDRLGPLRSIQTKPATMYQPALVGLVSARRLVAIDTFPSASITVVISTDGGTTFRRTASLRTNEQPRFVNGVGYVATRSGRQIAISSDGGVTWHEQAFS